MFRGDGLGRDRLVGRRLLDDGLCLGGALRLRRLLQRQLLLPERRRLLGLGYRRCVVGLLLRLALEGDLLLPDRIVGHL